MTYSLSEDFIQFVNALQGNNLKLCVAILETMENTSQTQAMWKDLRNASLKSLDLAIVMRCSVALGNIGEARFFKSMLKSAAKSNERKLSDYWEVKASILQLKRDFIEAERMYLSHNRAHDAIAMYEQVMMFKDALRIIGTANDSKFDQKKQLYLEYLLQNNQEIKAARVKESYGDYIDAIETCLMAGFPGKALQIISEKDIIHPRNVLESVVTALFDSGLFAGSGELCERNGEFQNALSHYIEGKVYRKALSLARDKVPSKVVVIEEMWGDSLVACGKYTDAIGHFVNAHVQVKAAKAALDAGMFDKALETLSSIDDASSGSLQSLKDYAIEMLKKSKKNSRQKALL